MLTNTLIANAMLGKTPIKRILLNDAQVWPTGSYVRITGVGVDDTITFNTTTNYNDVIVTAVNKGTTNAHTDFKNWGKTPTVQITDPGDQTNGPNYFGMATATNVDGSVVAILGGLSEYEADGFPRGIVRVFKVNREDGTYEQMGGDIKIMENINAPSVINGYELYSQYYDKKWWDSLDSADYNNYKDQYIDRNNLPAGEEQYYWGNLYGDGTVVEPLPGIAPMRSNNAERLKHGEYTNTRAPWLTEPVTKSGTVAEGNDNELYGGQHNALQGPVYRIDYGFTTPRFFSDGVFTSKVELTNGKYMERNPGESTGEYGWFFDPYVLEYYKNGTHSLPSSPTRSFPKGDQATSAFGEDRLTRYDGTTVTDFRRGCVMLHMRLSMNGDGTRIAISSPYASDDSSRVKHSKGIIKVFDYRGNNWVQVGGNIVGDDINSRIGSDIKLSGDGKTMFIKKYMYMWEDDQLPGSYTPPADQPDSGLTYQEATALMLSRLYEYSEVLPWLTPSQHTYYKEFLGYTYNDDGSLKVSTTDFWYSFFHTLPNGINDENTTLFEYYWNFFLTAEERNSVGTGGPSIYNWWDGEGVKDRKIHPKRDSVINHSPVYTVNRFNPATGRWDQIGSELLSDETYISQIGKRIKEVPSLSAYKLQSVKLSLNGANGGFTNPFTSSVYPFTPSQSNIWPGSSEPPEGALPGTLEYEVYSEVIGSNAVRVLGNDTRFDRIKISGNGEVVAVRSDVDGSKEIYTLRYNTDIGEWETFGDGNYPGWLDDLQQEQRDAEAENRQMSGHAAELFDTIVKYDESMQIKYPTGHSQADRRQALTNILKTDNLYETEQLPSNVRQSAAAKLSFLNPGLISTKLSKAGHIIDNNARGRWTSPPYVEIDEPGLLFDTDSDTWGGEEIGLFDFMRYGDQTIQSFNIDYTGKFIFIYTPYHLELGAGSGTLGTGPHGTPYGSSWASTYSRSQIHVYGESANNGQWYQADDEIKFNYNHAYPFTYNNLNKFPYGILDENDNWHGNVKVDATVLDGTVSGGPYRQLLLEGAGEGGLFKTPAGQPATIAGEEGISSDSYFEPTLQWLAGILGVSWTDFGRSTPYWRPYSSTYYPVTFNYINITYNDISKKDDFKREFTEYVTTHHSGEDIEQWMRESYATLHFKTPIQGLAGKFVEVNLYFGNDYESGGAIDGDLFFNANPLTGITFGSLHGYFRHPYDHNDLFTNCYGFEWEFNYLERKDRSFRAGIFTGDKYIAYNINNNPQWNPDTPTYKIFSGGTSVHANTTGGSFNPAFLEDPLDRHRFQQKPGYVSGLVVDHTMPTRPVTEPTDARNSPVHRTVMTDPRPIPPSWGSYRTPEVSWLEESNKIYIYEDRGLKQESFGDISLVTRAVMDFGNEGTPVPVEWDPLLIGTGTRSYNTRMSLDGTAVAVSKPYCEEVLFWTREMNVNPVSEIETRITSTLTRKYDVTSKEGDPAHVQENNIAPSVSTRLSFDVELKDSRLRKHGRYGALSSDMNIGAIRIGNIENTTPENIEMIVTIERAGVTSVYTRTVEPFNTASNILLQKLPAGRYNITFELVMDDGTSLLRSLPVNIGDSFNPRRGWGFYECAALRFDIPSPSGQGAAVDIYTVDRKDVVLDARSGVWPSTPLRTTGNLRAIEFGDQDMEAIEVKGERGLNILQTDIIDKVAINLQTTPPPPFIDITTSRNLHTLHGDGITYTYKP